MKTILIDLNILLDYLEERDGYEQATEIFKLVIDKKVKGFICAHEITTLSYFLQKNITEREKIVKIISGILKTFEIIEVDKEILNTALYSSVTDYEDAVIESSAKIKNIDYIITRNIKDFKDSLIKVLLPYEYLNLHQF